MAEQDVSDAVGVIVARFQVPELHAGHRYLVGYVCERHQDVLIILGVAKSYPTNRNPLSFEIREQMIRETFSGRDFTILPSLSSPASYDVRSIHIDSLIKENFPDRQAVIYGSRESFIHTYTGVFPVVEAPTVFPGSATEIRDSIAMRHTPDFRAGIIWNVVNRPSIGYLTVDVAVVHRELGQVMFVSKSGESGWRFPGSFFDSTIDNSYEEAGIRVINKEVPTISIGYPKLIASTKIQDWRYHGTRDGIVTLLLSAQYLGGYSSPGKGIDRVRWFNFYKVSDILVPEHKVLGEIMKNHWHD